MHYDSLRSEYSAFFQLLANDRGGRLRLNLPDTLLLQDGQPLAWFATNQEGYVIQRSAGRASIEDVRQHLLACSQDGSGRAAPYTAIMRLADGTPKLLTRPAFEALCDQLAAAAEAGELGNPSRTPCMLQAYVAPRLNLRFVTSYTNDGTTVSCHTFQRLFSRRYLPYRDPAATATAGVPGQPRSPAAAAAADDSMSAAAGVSAQAGAAAEESVEVELDEGALADSERRLAATVGPLDPALKMAARKAAHGLVQYVQKAHLLTLRGLVCEFVRDSGGHLWLLGPLRAEWASLIPGRGGEPWAAANLTKQPQEEESWPSTVEDEAAAEEGQQGAERRGGAAEDAGSLGEAAGSAGCTFGQAPPANADIMDRLPVPAPQLLETRQPGSPRIPAVLPPPMSTPLLPSLGGGSPQHPLALKAGLRRSPAQTSQWSSPTAGGGGGGCYWGNSTGSATCPAARASAAMTSHMTKQLVSLEDELLVKSDLADALAAKVQALEHDKHVVTSAFERVLGGLQGDLGEVKGRLEALRRERDGLAAQLEEARQKLAAAEEGREQLRAMLDAERGAAFLSLGQFQKQQEDASVRAARAEAELRTLQDRLQEERAACEALKKQMVFYQHASGDNCPGSPSGGVLMDGAGRVLRGGERPEIKYAETLQAVDELLMREADPTGERYSLSKVLHTCQGDLHAIFLHYCMLDAGFARHWPPQLTMQGWLAFMKDIGSTNLVPGTRTRSDNTMHVQEATEVFRRYCLRQAVMRAPQRLPSALTPATASVATGGVGDQTPHPPRPPSSQSTASAALSARPFSAASSLAGAAMNYQSFCAALVHVAAKVVRGRSEALEACPFLSEQTRAFVESVLPKAQQVAPIVSPCKKPGVGASPGGGAAKAGAAAAGGLGAKDAAAKEAAAKLPKLKAGGKAKGDKAAAAVAERASGGASRGATGAAAAAEMSAIGEASRDGSAAMASAGV